MSESSKAPAKKSTRKPAVNTSTPNIWEKLAQVQNELKAPKNQYNSFGKYKYRSKEDIIEAAKPLCINRGLLLLVNDELVLIGGRYYICSTATVTDMSTGDILYATGYAREGENKKGMDDAQLTGATASYAGKYALGNLFGLDDTKDADATNDHGKKPAPAKKSSPAPKPMTPEQKKSMLQAIKDGKGAVVAKRLATYADNADRKEVQNALPK